MKLTQKQQQRFLSNIQKTSTCWIWKNSPDTNGYGQMRIYNYRPHAHRIAYTIWKGVLRKGFVIDHLCRNRRCVNPTHLRQVRQAENIAASPNCLATINRMKTHCPRGHLLSGKNLHRIGPQKKWRWCKTCIKQAYWLYSKDSKPVENPHG